MKKHSGILTNIEMSLYLRSCQDAVDLSPEGDGGLDGVVGDADDGLIVPGIARLVQESDKGQVLALDMLQGHQEILRS